MILPVSAHVSLLGGKDTQRINLRLRNQKFPEIEKEEISISMNNYTRANVY